MALSFTWWDFPKKAWMLIFTQFTVIIFLSGWMFEEYLNNPFLQQYLNGVAPTVVPVLSVTFGAVAAMTATTLYIRVRRARLEQPDFNGRSLQPSAKRAPRKRAASSKSTVVRARTDMPGGLPSPTFVITESKPAENRSEATTQQVPETPIPPPAQPSPITPEQATVPPAQPSDSQAPPPGSPNSTQPSTQSEQPAPAPVQQATAQPNAASAPQATATQPSAPTATTGPAASQEVKQGQ